MKSPEPQVIRGASPPRLVLTSEPGRYWTSPSNNLSMRTGPFHPIKEPCEMEGADKALEVNRLRFDIFYNHHHIMFMASNSSP